MTPDALSRETRPTRWLPNAQWEHPTFLTNTLEGYRYTNKACLRKLPFGNAKGERLYSPRLTACGHLKNWDAPMLNVLLTINHEQLTINHEQLTMNN
jgi:hypothetical protein